MDNLFELLIFFFVIYSVISALMGKKKQQNTGKKIPQRYPGDAQTKTSPHPSPQDIFEEMLGFKIPKDEDEYQNTATQTSGSTIYEMPSIDYDTDLKVEYKDLETEQKIPDVDFDKLTVEQIDAIKKKEEIEQNLESYKLPSHANERAAKIRQKLKNPFSFREIFMISEILNKPKALRR